MLHALVAGVIPVIPAAGRDDAVEVGVGVDDARVLAHGSPHVEPPRAGHPAVDEGEAGALARVVPPVRRHRAEPLRRRVQLAVLRARVFTSSSVRNEQVAGCVHVYACVCRRERTYAVRTL